MKRNDFIPTLQRRTGVTAVGPSALRSQGKGVLAATQEFLGATDLASIPTSSTKRYRAWLNEQTDALLDALPVSGRPWGTARKALNLFMRDVLYNRYLNRHFGINGLEPWLEVPLDSAVAKGLKKHAGWGNLPQWPGLKNLHPETSDRFQGFALDHARAQGIERVHLDVYLWLENR